MNTIIQNNIKLKNLKKKTWFIYYMIEIIGIGIHQKLGGMLYLSKVEL